jgi:Fur family peroxide stress response transcriptional regulator
MMSRKAGQKDGKDERPRSRQTRQRRIVFDAVKQCKSHPTADWVFDRVRATMPNISLGTVYRNLSVLKDEGLLREIPGNDRRAHYDSNVDPHAHFICSSCGEIRDIKVKPTGQWRTHKELVGCEVTEQRIEFIGLCASCLRKPQQ